MNWHPATAFVGDKSCPLLGGGFLRSDFTVNTALLVSPL